MADHVEPLRNIQKRAAEVLRRHGLIANHATFTVDPQVGMQVIVTNDPDFREPDPVLDELEAIEKATEAEERKRAQEAQAKKARTELVDLKDQLRDPSKGIL